MKVTFLGAAQTVTGSNFLVEAAGQTFLVDCGMYQGKVTQDLDNSDPFLYKNEPMDLVLPQYIGAAGMFTGSPYVIVAPIMQMYMYILHLLVLLDLMVLLALFNIQPYRISINFHPNY